MLKKVDSNKSDGRIGYVVKRYPRFSETFIVNEILAHERAGLDLEIFSLRAPVDTHFQDSISHINAPVNYLSSSYAKSSVYWRMMGEVGQLYPALWETLGLTRKTDVQDFYHAMHLALLIHQKKITHLHAHFATSATTAARWAARIAGIRYSVTMHANDIFHESVDPADLVAKIDDSKFVVTVSEYNRQYLAKRFDCTDKIHRIYNGLDLKKFGYKSPVSRPRRIVAVGRLVHKKGFADLIDACRLLADQAIDFSCDIIGGGELERALGDHIAQLQLHDRVRLTGPLPQNDVRRIIGQSAMLVAPCVVADDGNRDGLPTVITEALALGTPCISTAVTGIPEIVRDQETGIIVSQNSPHELASAMIRLLDNERLGISLATSARQLVEREFDLHNNVARIRELFLDSAIKSPHFSTANQVV